MTGKAQKLPKVF